MSNEAVGMVKKVTIMAKKMTEIFKKVTIMTKMAEILNSYGYTRTLKLSNLGHGKHLDG